MLRLCRWIFLCSRITTDAGFEVKQLLHEEKQLILQLWDIPGNEIFGCLTSVLYKYVI
jgi:hypothetical protein